MCHFKSAIVVQDEREKLGYRLLLNAWTESHSDLIRIHKLRDDGKLRFARIEYSPPDGSTAHRVETYKLKIDEERKPDWFDDEISRSVEKRMADYIKSIIIEGDVDMLIGGQFILAPKAKVACLKTAVVNFAIGAEIGEMWGSSMVGEMWESSKVGAMRESSKVGEMRESSKVGAMWGSSKVGEMWGSSKVTTDKRETK